ncbi:MAG TPA: hypothetical protein VH307_12630 [Streptosporangiaceae bacterium]|jgi:hypothetical protein|nr:hypothetical protein [Streptosporangiaceae bacterium]
MIAETAALTAASNLVHARGLGGLAVGQDGSQYLVPVGSRIEMISSRALYGRIPVIKVPLDTLYRAQRYFRPP